MSLDASAYERGKALSEQVNPGMNAAIEVFEAEET